VESVSWYAYQVPHQLLTALPSSRLSSKVKVGGGVGVPVFVRVGVGWGVPPTTPTKLTTLCAGRL